MHDKIHNYSTPDNWDGQSPLACSWCGKGNNENAPGCRDVPAPSANYVLVEPSNFVRVKYYVPSLQNSTRSKIYKFCVDMKIPLKIKTIKSPVSDLFSAIVEEKEDFALELDLSGPKAHHDCLRDFIHQFDGTMYADDDLQPIRHCHLELCGETSGRDSSDELEAISVVSGGESEIMSEGFIDKATRGILKGLGAKSPTEAKDLVGGVLLPDHYVPEKQTLVIKRTLESKKSHLVDVLNSMDLDTLKEAIAVVLKEHVDVIWLVKGDEVQQVTARHHISNGDVLVVETSAF